MKKLIVAVISLMIINLVVVGCNSSAATTPATKPAASAPTTSEPTITLSYSGYQPAGIMIETLMADWTKKIETNSNGRVKFKNFFGATLIPGDQAWVELQKGTADIVEVPAQLNSSTFPIINGATTFVNGAKNMETDLRIFHQLMNDIPEFSKEWSGAKILLANNPGEQQLQSTRPIRTLAEFKGLKMRIAGTWLKDTFANLGVSLITTPAPDVYISLQKNIIESDIHPMEFLQSYKTGEIEKYTTMMNLLSIPQTMYCMNLNSYNKLPKDIQKIIDDSLPQLEKDMVINVNKINDAALAWCLSIGPHEVITLSADDMAKFNVLAYAESQKSAASLDAKGLPGTKMLERATQLIKNQ